MSLRFRKSIKILPGVKVNISKKGISSIGLGKSGASINLNKKGIRTNIGIPGTGISYSKYHPNKKLPEKELEQEPSHIPIKQQLTPSPTSPLKNYVLLLVGICCFLIGVIFF